MTHRFVLSCRFSSFGYGKKYTNFYKTIQSFYWRRVLVQETIALFPAGKERLQLKAE